MSDVVAKVSAIPGAGQQFTGILPGQWIRDAIAAGDIVGSSLDRIEDDQVQPASIDLRLGRYAYPVRTSFLPGKELRVLEKLKRLDPEFENFKIDLREGAMLSKDRIYVIPLLEFVNLRNSEITAFSNPKSSTGRLDILTRLIADHATHFDQLEPGYKGNLFLEVAPRSFNVVVKTGTRLNQLRFSRARGEGARGVTASEWNALLDQGQICDPLPIDRKRTGYLPFTIDLEGSRTEGKIVGYRARKYANRIDIDRRDYDPLEFWEPLRFHKSSPLILEPDEFYILMTRESIAVPPEYAAEMMPYDTRAGEFRVHYAGFFDPGFGWNPTTKRVGGSRGVLEVRSHEVPFLLEHGQIVGWLRYDRMAAPPSFLYGQDAASNYQGQRLKLSKQFAVLDE
ncbi:MAG TPA: 2'-deoxycytidine 5'-triphosphate deaminase [Burkholderiales bacterium]|nr:2'-deoxycytidine 5'-triphosphate deaminase [Burkholderiales bacterium]